MNYYLLTAAILCFLLGLIHSFLGEFLIFKNKREKGTFIPSQVNQDLKERHLRILWATWHLASVFGWCIGAILIKISINPSDSSSSFTNFIILSAMYTMFMSSALVLVGTKGKHPGWVVLIIIGTLLMMGV
ncbi:MAG: hypothetical protein R8N23_15070 [Reichenbachiella sp.]|uniref:hypothetical protein n=1 Tax=Reichenbachiella sp. TaxID=2184521 RepID=UPI00296741F2|nr:hypothetical protein [Reichenbachiella sp.]MDW3211195.1 hypothetical protein [Reichenbachiella sp.]